MSNIVYVLTNAAMPGIVKIGMTDRPDVQQRMRDLYTTGTPLPFDCVIAWQIEGPAAVAVEQALHTAFDPHRINPGREFFQLDPTQVEVLMRVLPGRDVTPSDASPSAELPPEEQEAVVKFKRRRSRTNEAEFLEALTDHGRLVYEHVLALVKQDDLEIRWGGTAFTLYVVPSGAVVCRGYPQRLTTDFGSLRQQANLPQSVLAALKAEAEQTNLFERIGKHNSLVCPTDRLWDEPQLTVLIGWLRSVAERVHEYATETDDPAAEG